MEEGSSSEDQELLKRFVEAGGQVFPGAERYAIEQQREREGVERERRELAREYHRLKITDDARERLRREKLERRIGGELSGAAVAYRDSLLASMRDAAGLDEIEDPDPIVEGLLFQDSLAWIAGPSGAYKSFAAFDLAARYGRTDMDFHGEAMEHGKALVFVAEGGRAYKHRKRAWEKTHGPIRGVTFVPSAIQLADMEAAMPALISVAREHRYGLIIFDTQAMCTVGQDENSAEDMGVIINALHQLREATGACILLVHHFGKSSGAGMRGNSALYAAATTVITVERFRDSKEIIKLSTRSPTGKQKDDIERDDLKFRLELVKPDGPGKPSLVPIRDRTHDVPVLPDVSARDLLILDALLDTEDAGGLTSSQIAKYVQERDPRQPNPWGANNALSWMDKLIKNETACKSGATYKVTPMGRAVVNDSRQ